MNERLINVLMLLSIITLIINSINLGIKLGKIEAMDNQKIKNITNTGVKMYLSDKTYYYEIEEEQE